MYKTVQVILVVALVICAVEFLALIVNYFEPFPVTSQNQEFYESAVQRTILRWKVYWFSGVLVAISGYLLRTRADLLGYGLLITGIYLMLVGNNGGFSARGYIIPRMGTSILTFMAIVYLIKDEVWGTGNGSNSNET